MGGREEGEDKKLIDGSKTLVVRNQCPNPCRRSILTERAESMVLVTSRQANIPGLRGNVRTCLRTQEEAVNTTSVSEDIFCPQHHKQEVRLK